MRPRSVLLAVFAIVTLLSSTTMTALAAPPGTPTANGNLPKGVVEMCLFGRGTDGQPTAVSQCLLYLLSENVKRPDLKRLQVIGIGVGPEGILLDQPQVVDATDPNVVVKGKGRTKDGTTKEVNVKPADYTAAYVNCDLILYQHANNGGIRSASVQRRIHTLSTTWPGS